jgi:predicted dehydrogenase
MTTRPLRAAVVGLGHMGRHHARTLQHLGRVHLVAAVDPAADRWGAAPDIPVFPNLSQLLDHDIDYAVLAAPTHLHTPLGIALAKAGIPSLIEKPLAPDINSANALAAAFNNTNTLAGVGYVERCNPALIALHALLRNGLLGQILHIDTRRGGPYPARVTDSGVLSDLATHDFDTTTWLTGQRYQSVTALTTRRGGHEHLATIIGQLEHGTTTHHTATWLSPIAQRLTIVTGERGSLIANTMTQELEFLPNPENRTQSGTVRYDIPRHDPLHTEHERFRDTITGLRPIDVPLADGVAAVQTAETALETADSVHAASLSARI